MRRRDNAKQLIVGASLALVLGLVGCGQQQQGQTGTASSSTTESQQASATVPVAPDFQAATVSYLGPQGTYSEEATQHVFDTSSTFDVSDTVVDAVGALTGGTSDYAVIPQENTIGGPVIDNLDLVLDNAGISVVGEVELPISQNLLVLPGAKLEEITHVYSHKQGISQGKAWLAENLPNAVVEEVSSTAEGARMVQEGSDPTCAAICSVGCADVYGLEVLAKDIQQNDDNVTRFYVLSLKEPGCYGTDRMAFVATGSAEGLPQLLGKLEEAGSKLVVCNSRPAKDVLGHYRYLIECAPADMAAYESIAKTDGFEFRLLGGYDLY